MCMYIMKGTVYNVHVHNEGTVYNVYAHNEGTKVYTY